jgi:hypothetical protein
MNLDSNVLYLLLLLLRNVKLCRNGERRCNCDVRIGGTSEHTEKVVVYKNRGLVKIMNEEIENVIQSPDSDKERDKSVLCEKAISC